MIALHQFDVIIVNSSGGKDSLASLYEVVRQAKAQDYPMDQIVVSHQDLKSMEWEGTKELVEQQAALFGLSVEISAYRDKDGNEKDLLDYVERRGMWPSSKARFCTSDFKRGPGGRVITKLTKGMDQSNVLYVFGFRKQESTARSKKEPFTFNKRQSTKTREVWDWLPIHDWTEERVWSVIKGNDLPYHRAYDLGMPRLSCCFCIFSPFDALVVAGRENPELLQRYVDQEARIGHSFKSDLKLASVKAAIDEGYEPKKIKNWIM